MAAISAIALAGCQDKPSSGTDSNKPVSIGISLPLTGDFSQPGGEAKRGCRGVAGHGERRQRISAARSS
jgi:branched-chain amino acid transport system substrate-binding protein